MPGLSLPSLWYPRWEVWGHISGRDRLCLLPSPSGPESSTHSCPIILPRFTRPLSWPNSPPAPRCWDALSRTFEVGPGSSVDARVSTFYYPHWIATANGRALATRPGADGALLISLPPEAVTIDLEFREPPRAKVSTVVSIISWTLLASLLIFDLFATTRRQYDSTESRPAPAQ